MNGRMSRRGFLRGLGAGAVVLGGGAALSGCAGVGGAKAAPTAQKTKILLVVRFWGYGSTVLSSTEATVDALIYEYTQPWRAQNPGVDIKVLPNVGGPQAMVSDLLDGDGPDIYHSYHPDVLFSSPGFTTDLTPYIAESHANLNVFNQAQMSLFQQPSGILALPAYLGILTLAVNLGLIDNLGLERPTTGWTYQDYATLVHGVTGATGGKVVGGGYGLGNVGTPTPYLPAECILQGFGGGYVQAGDNSVCTADSPGSGDAFNWIYPLALEGSVANPNGGGALPKGTSAMALASSWSLITYAKAYQGLNWSFHELPILPAVKSPVCSCTSDFYALNPRGQHLDLAWSLLHWMVFEPYWQQSMMKLFLLSPALVSLWDEWVTKVQSYAPPLASKNVGAFRDLAQGGHAYPEPFMLYEADPAYQIMATVGQEMWNGTYSIQEGLTQMTDEVNALEKTAATSASSTPAAPGQYAAPPTQGAGDPYTNGSPYIVVGTTGTVTMLGTGYDIALSQDACMFYCKSSVKGKDSWTCRVDALSNVSCPSLSPWAKAGLMARANLSDDAPMVTVHVTGANDIEFSCRPLAGNSPVNQTQLLPSGFKPPLMSPVATPTPNFLINPIWLRLERDGYTWTAYASTDGTTFSPLGTSASSEMKGCWVGVVATAHNSDFSDKGYTRAVFDHLSFQPTQEVQLGVTGVAPAGGPVPKNWATLTTPVPS